LRVNFELYEIICIFAATLTHKIENKTFTT